MKLAHAVVALRKAEAAVKAAEQHVRFCRERVKRLAAREGCAHEKVDYEIGSGGPITCLICGKVVG